VLILHGKDRAERFGEIAAADLVLTTYPLLVRDRETLLAQDWHLLVMDEAQFIKNPKAQSHQVARLPEGAPSPVADRHAAGKPPRRTLGAVRFPDAGPARQCQTLHPGVPHADRKAGRRGNARPPRERVRPFLLRRTKEQVLKDLPPRTEMVRWVEIEGGQRDLYESLRVAFDRKLRHGC
jgi:SNF2 family DNA or RNA helicase